MTETEKEAIEVQERGKVWLDSLFASGVAPTTIAAGVLTALAECMLVAQGKPYTVARLRAHADFIDQVGDEMLRALGH